MAKVAKNFRLEAASWARLRAMAEDDGLTATDELASVIDAAWERHTQRHDAEAEEYDCMPDGDTYEASSDTRGDTAAALLASQLAQKDATIEALSRMLADAQRTISDALAASQAMAAHRTLGERIRGLFSRPSDEQR